MYLSDEITCGDIRAHLISNDFACSEKQIKNRLREWNFECKKTPSGEYLAMFSYANSGRGRRYEVVFDVPKHLGRAYFSRNKIKKECDRLKIKCERGHASFSLPSFEDAEVILSDADIRTWRKVAGSDCLLPLQPYPDSEACDYERNFLGEPPAIYMDWIVSVNDNVQVREVEVESESACASLENERTCPSPTVAQTSAMRLTNPHTISNGDSLALIAKDSPYSQWTPCENNDLTWKPSNRDDQTTSMTCAEPSTVSSHAVLMAVHMSDNARFLLDVLDTRRSLTSLREDWHKEELMSSLDVSGSQDIIMDEGDYSNSDAGECFKPLENGFSGPRIDSDPLVSQNSQSPKNSVDEITSEHDESQVISKVQQGLREAGDWLLPGLLWQQLILGLNGQDKAYQDFLSTTCTAIEKAPDLENRHAISLPFRYALAEARQDSDGIARWGEDLPEAYARIKNSWGIGHPNSLIFAHYVAWHDLYCDRVENAITRLKETLAISERSMGLHSIVTISCLAILSRALDQNNDLNGAIVYIEKALDRLDGRRSDLEKYRSILLHRCGVLLRRTNRPHEAIQCLLVAFYGRLIMYSIESGELWSAITELSGAFLDIGQVQTADEIVDYATKRFNWVVRLAWARENEIELPRPRPPSWMPPEVIAALVRLDTHLIERAGSHTNSDMVLHDNSNLDKFIDDDANSDLVPGKNTNSDVALDHDINSEVAPNYSTGSDMGLDDNINSDIVLDDDTNTGVILNEDTNPDVILDDHTDSDVVFDDDTSSDVVLDDDTNTDVVSDDDPNSDMVLDIDSDSVDDGYLSTEHHDDDDDEITLVPCENGWHLSFEGSFFGLEDL
ncbi:hypothetical protein RBB50_006449 [Rhinocladiella similis]